MKKLFIALLFVAFLASCGNTNDLTVIDERCPDDIIVNLVFTDGDLLKSTQGIVFDDSETFDITTTNAPANLVDIAEDFIEYASANDANAYGPIYPSVTIARLNFTSDNYDNIQIIIYESASDSDVVYIGIDIFDLSDFNQILYYDVYNTDFIDILKTVVDS